MAEVSVTRNDAASRYEIALDGQRIGLADFVDQGNGVVVLPHTEIDPAHEGNGYAGILVGHLLDELREQGKRIVPACSYVRVYLQRHPEYADLVA